MIIICGEPVSIKDDLTNWSATLIVLFNIILAGVLKFTFVLPSANILPEYSLSFERNLTNLLSVIFVNWANLIAHLAPLPQRLPVVPSEL